MSEALLRKSYDVEAGDFESAGDASAGIKATLKRLGIPMGIVRRVAIAAYEAEINLIIHSMGGSLTLTVDGEAICLVSDDRGPGIPSVEKALQAGWSTAPDSVRSLGFGAGMGLPNMKKNADDFTIESTVNVGTHIVMRFLLSP